MYRCRISNSRLGEFLDFLLQSNDGPNCDQTPNNKKLKPLTLLLPEEMVSFQYHHFTDVVFFFIQNFNKLLNYVNLLADYSGERKEKSYLGKRGRVFVILHCDVYWTRQHLEISIYSVWKRRWCFPNSVYSRTFLSGKAILLFGNDNGSV